MTACDISGKRKSLPRTPTIPAPACADMALKLTPGLSFLLQRLPLLSLPFLVGVALPRLASTPLWVSFLAGVLTLPSVAAGYIIYTNWRNERAAAALGARLIPRVKGNSIGNVDILKQMQYNRKFGYPADGLGEAIEDLGPTVNIRVLWMATNLTVEPEHIKLILATDFNNYVKGERFQYNMRSVLGTGVFNSDGEGWKFHRQMTRPFFNRDRISHFDIFDRHAQDVVAHIKQRNRAGYAVDFQVPYSNSKWMPSKLTLRYLKDLIGRFTMDSASEFLFDSCINSLKAHLPYPHNVPPSSLPIPPTDPVAIAATRFTDAFTEAMLRISEREVLGRIWPLFEIAGDKTKRAMGVISEYLDPIIQKAVDKKRGGGMRAMATDEEKDGMSLLDEMLDQTDDPQVLKDEMLNMLLAGRDTTMHTLTVVIYFFTMYPDIYRRARDETLAQIGPTRRPTYEDVKELKFLRAVINETMRLYPSVPFNVRENIQATTWPSPDPSDPRPLYIPAGSKLAYSVFMMHRRKDLWGPDAEEFDPDRFLDDRVKQYLLKNAFQFLPFNAGPRICLGQQFAYNEMSFMLVRLLQSFTSFERDEAAFAPAALPPPEWAALQGRKGVDRVRFALHLTMSTKGGLWVRAVEAE
ncbi:Cytochrome P450 monooxygenase [Mycena chlorophos]|uniref:Cytochrome P450 monooxygenase n=1 Tax=Mycena chlorophos TaxID=658473 RepID=A0A8H6VX23_MYCCL|nr:Cytochrome P450 monooxygenase [Mycena chlorophos]